MNMDEIIEAASQSKMQLGNIIQCNVYTEKFQLFLSDKDAHFLLQERKRVLNEQKRVEFGDSILPKLIFTFCDSLFLSQSNYVESLQRLQEIFYYYKNEFGDQIGDDELLECMKKAFDGECQGSFELLEGTVLWQMIHNRNTARGR